MALQKKAIPRETGNLGDGTCFVVDEFTKEEREEMDKNYLQNENAYKLIKFNPGGWMIPERYLKLAPAIYNFKFRPDDVVIMTYPKSGTIWVQEVAWTMLHNPNLDNPEAILSPHVRAVQFDLDIHVVEKNSFDETDLGYEIFQRVCPGSNYKDGVFLQICDAASSPRMMKTHLPFPFYEQGMLDKCKVIYIARNPYDVAISFFHYSKRIAVGTFAGDFDQYLDYFMEGKSLYSPYWGHIKQAWQMREHPNFHFVFYEDFKHNPEAEIRRLDKFLQTNLTNDQIENVLFQTSFENLKKMDLSGVREPLNQDFFNKDKIGGHFRKGKSGGWRDELSALQKEKVARWIEENTRDCDIKFKYE